MLLLFCKKEILEYKCFLGLIVVSGVDIEVDFILVRFLIFSCFLNIFDLNICFVYCYFLGIGWC